MESCLLHPVRDQRKCMAKQRSHSLYNHSSKKRRHSSHVQLHWQVQLGGRRALVGRLRRVPDLPQGLDLAGGGSLVWFQGRHVLPYDYPCMPESLRGWNPWRLSGDWGAVLHVLSVWILQYGDRDADLWHMLQLSHWNLCGHSGSFNVHCMRDWDLLRGYRG